MHYLLEDSRPGRRYTQLSPKIPGWPLGRTAAFFRILLQTLLLFPLHRLFARPFTVTGLEQIGGLVLPALFISNHASHIDTVSIVRALPSAVRRNLVLAAAQDYFYRNKLIGTATSLLVNTFPFSRTGAIRTSLDYCGFLTKHGWSVLVYPEGTRSETGELLPFKRGIGLLATHLHVPIVPISVSGGNKALPKGRIIPRPAPITVRFGQPLAFTGLDSPADVVITLQDTVAALMAATTQCSRSGENNDRLT